MVQQNINVGSAPDDHTGDPLRTSFEKCNANFTELFNKPAAGGDVVGPAAATDNAVARFDTATGKLLQDSGLTVGDGGVSLALTKGGQVVLGHDTTVQNGTFVIRSQPPHGQNLTITPRNDFNGALTLSSGGGFYFDSALSIGNGSAVSNTVALSNQASGTTRAIKISSGLLNLPITTAPSAPTDGDVWMQSDGLYFRLGGATKKVTFA